MRILSDKPQDLQGVLVGELSVKSCRVTFFVTRDRQNIPFPEKQPFI
jgi:hypothetical protein